jgi:hypothetical protein
MNGTRQEAYVAGFKAEHREMHGVLRNVEKAWRACEAGGWKEGDRCQLCEAMTALREHLGHHFAQEEAGGYLEEALLAAPKLAPTADQLLAQHPMLLKNCCETVEKLRQAPADAAIRRRLRDEYLNLRRKLLEHERGENAVMQAAFHVDLEAT